MSAASSAAIARIPSDYAPLTGFALTSVLELAFLDPRRKVIIGESSRLDEGEPFTHPVFMVILQNLRRLPPQTTLAVTTNGTLLTPPMVQTLVELQPLELISLNSATARGRHQLWDRLRVV